MTNIRFFIALGLLGLAVVQRTATAEVPPDWDKLSPITHGALFENAGDAPADANDISEIRVAETDNSLQLQITFVGPMKKGHEWGTFVLFDTDLNRRTGFVSGPLGVDYLAQVQGDEGSSLLVHHRGAKNNDDNFQGWEPQKVLDNALTRATSTGGNSTLTLRIPWLALGITDRGQTKVRFRVCESSQLLPKNKGEWSPDIAEGFFSIGADPRSMAKLPNVLVHGDLDALDTARATQTPTGWVFHDPAGQGSVQAVSTDADHQHHALRIAVNDNRVAGANATPFAARRGVVTFRYKIDRSAVSAKNLGMQVIGLQDGSGLEGCRINYSPPANHIGDGQWHRASMDFRFPTGIGRALVAPRVNENTPAVGAADWTVDDIEAFTIPEGISIGIGNLWVKAPRLRAGATTDVSAFIENGGGQAIENFTARLHADGPIRIEQPTQALGRIDAGGFQRMTWPVTATGAGPIELKVTLEAGAGVDDDLGEGTRESEYRMLATGADETVDRAEVNTDEKGFWRRLPRPATLQAENPSPLSAIDHKRSGEIGHNTYGICTQIPRDRDYEKPFDASHLIDGDPTTCWSSMQRNNPFPGDPPTVTIRLAKPAEVKQINLIPYWNNTDFPRGFSVTASVDGKSAGALLVVQSHELARGGEKRGDKFVQAFPLVNTPRIDTLTFTFDRLPLAGGNYAEVSTGYKARLAEIEVIDANGANAALASHGARVEVSDTFTGWQNTADNIRKYYKKIFELGVKWVRIGQWGDQTEWAAVERTKGEFAMDKSTDAAIHDLADNGVDILYGLQYGNHLYNDVNENPTNKPWMDLGPIFNEGSPFYLNNGPRTEEARQAFVRYVDYVVRRYHKQVKFWELWNEENGWYPGHEADLYGKLLAAVGAKVKEIDPTAKFSFGGTAAPAPVTTEIALRHGGAPYVDITAFHPYGIDKAEGGMGTMENYEGKSVAQSKAETGWNKLEDILAGVRQPFAKHGRPNVEVWMNEFGTNVTGRDYVYSPGIGEYGSAKWLMRMYVYGAWNDSRAAWWALHTDNKSQDWGILDPVDFSMRPMALSLRNVCSTLSDVTPIKEPIASLETDASDPRCISFARDGGGEVLTAVWATDSFDDKAKEYRGDLEQKCEKKPQKIEVIDLYWGLKQEAKWEWSAGTLRIKGLLLRDYPIVVSLK